MCLCVWPPVEWVAFATDAVATSESLQDPAWWEGFWGWAITAVLALIAAVGVVVYEVRRLLDRPTVDFRVRRLGEVKQNTTVWDLFIASNPGTADLRIIKLMLVGARPGVPADSDQFRIPQTIRAGDEHRFTVLPGGVEDAWILIVARHPFRRGRVLIWWHPLDEQGPLGDALLEQLVAWRSRRSRRARMSRWLRRVKKRVEPGGAPLVTVKSADLATIEACLPEVVGVSLLP